MKWLITGIILFIVFFSQNTFALNTTWKEYEAKTNLLTEQKNYDEAANVAQNAYQFAKEHLQQNNLKIAAALNSLIIIYKQKGDYQKAIDLCKKYITLIKTATNDTNHPYLARGYHLMGTLQEQIGNIAEAESYFTKSLTTYQNGTATNHPLIIPVLIDLAKNQGMQQKYEEAEMNLIRVLMISENYYGPEHLKVARAANYLGEFYMSRGKLSEAEFFFKRALKILSNKILWEQHPLSLEVTQNMAALYLKLNKKSLAKKFKKEAKKIAKLQKTASKN